MDAAFALAAPSAIIYYFGSQEELIVAVAERVYRRLNAERLKLLYKATERNAPGPPDLEEVIAALIGAIGSLEFLGPSSSYPVLAHFISLFQQNGHASYYRALVENVEHHKAFIAPLQRIAPWLDELDIGWRLNCALGIRTQVIWSPSRTEVLTGHCINLKDPETVIARIIETIAPMFRRTV